MLDNGEHEQDRGSYQNQNYDGDVEDVNDETTYTSEEVGNFYCDGKWIFGKFVGFGKIRMFCCASKLHFK